MEEARCSEEAPVPAPVDILVISEVRFLRDCLTEMLARDPSVRVHEGCATPAHALDAAMTLRPGMVLLDGAFPDGVVLASRLRAFLPAAKIVAIALDETEETILAWAEAGITGYVANTTSLSELSARLRTIAWGEQSCSSRIAGALLRRIGAAPKMRGIGQEPRAALTGRERDVLRLVGAGLTNKDIARRLEIGLGTTKTHVHNILRKLNLSNRLQIAVQANRIDKIASNEFLMTHPPMDYTLAYTRSIPSD